MKRATTAAAVPAIALTVALTGCGSNSTTSSTAASTAGASSTAVATTTSTTGATTASQCPTSNTRSFAKTRFVTDIGLTAGTFHRYIYKPYQAGTFAKGASGRKTAIVKGVLAAGLDAKLLDNAYKNVQANPTLCKVLIVPLGQLKNATGSLKTQLLTGNTASVATIEGLVKKVEGTSASNGAAITENDSITAAQSEASGS